MRKSKYNEEVVKGLLLDLYKKNGGKPFTSTFMIKNGQSSARQWIYSNHGSPLEFCEKFNISYVMKNARTQRKWTDKRIVQSIKEAFEKKGSKVNDRWMSYNGYATPLSRIKTDGYTLYSFAKKHNVEDLVTVKHRHKGYTEDEIKEDFIYLHKKIKIPLCQTVLFENGCRGHVIYIRKHFNDLDTFIEKHGLSDIFEKRYTVLTNSTVVNRIINLSEILGRNISMKDVQNNDNGATQFIYRNYNNFEEFCKENNLMKLYTYKGGVSWCDEEAIRIIKEIYDQIKSKVNQSDLESFNYHGLIHYIRREYRNFQDFINKNSMENYMYISNISDAISFGQRYEEVVKRMFESLSLNYVYQYRGFEGIRPDFYDEKHKIIIDTKLSSYTAFNISNDFFERYTAECDKLIILYLRGKEIISPDENVEFRSVSHYYESLREMGKESIIHELEDLKNEYESFSNAS